jgi:hypothetical protein
MFNLFLWVIAELKKLKNSFNHKEEKYERELENNKDTPKQKVNHLDIFKKGKQALGGNSD